MTMVIKPGHRTWKLIRDKVGHREYKITHLVEGESTDGPMSALLTPGLPVPGSVWAFDDDVDGMATCMFDAEVTPLIENEPNQQFEVAQLFSTKPLCLDLQIENPLAQPNVVSGGFVKFTKEATHDRFGLPILNSAHEMLRGPTNEWDENRPTVKIEQNVASLELGLLCSMIDTLNTAPLWGLPARCIKLSNVSWEKKYFGTCSAYYTRSLEFEINFQTFDRDLLDEGTKVINGHWDNATGQWTLDNINGAEPNRFNPAHFIRFKDRQGENCRVILDGEGRPVSKPPPLVDGTAEGCDECGDTAPRSWRVSGFTGDNTIYNNAVLAYVYGCRWEANVSIPSGVAGIPPTSSTIVLEAVDGQWQVSGNLLDGVWRHWGGTEWTCTGQNTLIKDGEFDCEQCDEGAVPSTWTLSGFTGDEAIYNVTLEIVGNCLWSAVVDGATISMSFALGGFRLTVPSDGLSYTPTDDWVCNGANVMQHPIFPTKLVTATPGAGSEFGIVVSSGGETEAGTRHVQKYNESNFLALGIPLVF